MVFHNRFRTAWWLVLLALSSIYLIGRSSDLIKGNTNIFDIFVFVPWFSLMLVPIFQEMDFLGFRFKQEIKDDIRSINNELKEQILNFRMAVQNSIDFKQTYNPIINVGALPSDAELKTRQENIDDVVERVFAEKGFIKPVDTKLEFSSSDDAIYLFQVRYEIETELRRLALSSNIVPSHRLYGIRLLNALTKVIIPIEISTLINEVWRICTPAIHGEQASETQLQFVRKSYNEFMPFLKSIEIME